MKAIPAALRARAAPRVWSSLSHRAKALDNPLKSGHNCTESFDSWFFSRDDFAYVIPQFLKRRGLVSLPIHLLKYLHQMIEGLRFVAAKPVSKTATLVVGVPPPTIIPRHDRAKSAYFHSWLAID